MARCEQELCERWSGDGDVCPCAVLGIERSASTPPCPFCGEPDDDDAPWCCDKLMEARGVEG